MTKNSRPSSKKSAAGPEDADDALAQQLCSLALDLVEQEDGDTLHSALSEQQRQFQLLIKNCLLHKKDDVLYEAIEHARDIDIDACQFLRSTVQQAAEAAFIRRNDDTIYEVNAFVIPLFVHSTGGLQAAQTFQDQAAFDALTASFKSAQLESPESKVVLVAHAYHLDEIDRITFSQINEMTRDAGASLLGKKSASTAALEKSLSGWPPSFFEAFDTALELRFLLGFALKKADDPFYAVPDDEACADAYFTTREQRFQQWTGSAGPLLKRCLADAEAGIEIDFLYQDLFFGGKEHGIAEYYTLQMMSELNLDLQEHAVEAADTFAVIAPADAGGEMTLRVNLYLHLDGRLVASAEKPLAALDGLHAEVDDARDALSMIGVRMCSMALKFDASGKPVDARPMQA
jgi:hypothetical protein